jgi:HD superfamily phosphohydrolase
MPNWGLTEVQRDLLPWGLDPELLKPHKITTDPIHGDVHTTVLEQALIDTRPFQRLRRVRQLGTTHEVYPGATHTRFSHSLGALRVVQDLLDGVMAQREGRHPVHDLISQWVEINREQAEYDVAQAVVVARLGAVLHDLCHVPFGHSIEDDLDVLVDHDANGPRFTRLWGTLVADLPSRLDRHLPPGADRDQVMATLGTLTSADGELHRELRPLIISKDDFAKQLQDDGELKYPFTADLVGNTICADLLDYLLRDHLYTGLPAALGRRFTSAFFVVPKRRGPYSERIALNIMQNGHERTDVISELLKALRYRYELSERALYHHTKLAADVMVGKALDLWSRAVWLEQAADVVAELDELEDLVETLDHKGLRRAAEETLTRQQKDADAEPPLTVEQITERQQERLEDVVLAHGDDGLLEHLAALDAGPAADGPTGPVIDDLHRQVAVLGSALLDRQLFTIGGRVGIDDAPAEKLFKGFGDIAARTAAQDEAQRFAEITTRDPRVLIWLPDPEMRLKLARVLVDNGEHINEFQAYEQARGDRGMDIYSAHRKLWSLWVFLDRSLTKEEGEAALVYLAGKFGVAWERMRPTYGPDPGNWVVRHGLSRLLDTEPTSPKVTDLLPAAEQVMARGPAFETLSDVVARLGEIEDLRGRAPTAE